MKKFAVILVLLSLTRIGVAYADTTNASTSQNYFFGTKSAAANLNQVLALLVGPKGDPGPAGVAGKDGLIGMNGKDGKDGLNGAPGVAGADGTGVLSVAFTGAQGNCTSGGVKFTDGAGTVTYACNGLNGSPGGGGGGTTNVYNTYQSGDTTTGYLEYGTATLKVGSCEADGKVYIQPNRMFDGRVFTFGSIYVGTNDLAQPGGDIHSTCASTNAKDTNIYFYFTIRSSGVTVNSNYVANDVIACKYTLPQSGSWPANNGSWQFTVSDSNSACGKYGSRSGSPSVFTKVPTPSYSFEMSDIDTADYTDQIGFEIG